jgi:hypothetical protein
MLADKLDVDLFLTGNRIDFNIPISLQDEEKANT